MDTEHDRVLGPVQLGDDVGDLGDQFRIGGELERLHPPGMEAVLTPPSGHRPASRRRGAIPEIVTFITSQRVSSARGARVTAINRSRSRVRGRPGQASSNCPDAVGFIRAPPVDRRLRDNVNRRAILGMSDPVTGE
jgi:hypothetical protein